MTWASIILAVLTLVNKLLDIGQQNKWIKAGEDKQIAASSAAILQKTTFAKETLSEITKLKDTEVDDLLRRLEPGGR